MTDDLFRRSARLDAEIAKADPEGAIERLITSGRRNRRHIRVLYITLAIVVVIVGLNVFLTFRVLSNSSAIRQVCRTEQALWGPILKANKEHPQPGETQEQRQQAARFRHTLDTCGG